MNRAESITLAMAAAAAARFRPNAFAQTRPEEKAYLALQPGVEVAQINWNGGATALQWVKIEDAVTGNDTPQIEMHSLIEPGASGGGVFWQGRHVANNWYRVVMRDADRRQIVDSYSTAALNTPGISDFDGRVLR